MGLSFENIEYAWLFAALIPVFLFWMGWEWRKKTILQKMVSHPGLLKTLIKNYNPHASKFRLVTFSLALVAIVVALINPRVEEEKANVPVEGVQLMLMVDVSNSMLADDVAPNRLEKARSFAIQLAEGFGGSRIGLVAFAGEARLQMPPTSDLGAIRQALQTLSPSSVALQGTDIEAALREAYRSLSANAVAQKCVVVISDGEALEGNTITAARTLSKSGMLVHVVGVGSANGARLFEPETGLPIVNDGDQPVISRLNEEELSKLAEVTGGRYLHLQETKSALTTMIGYLNELEKIPLENGDLINYYSFAPWILLLALLLLTWEWWLPLLKNIFYLKKKAATIAAIILQLLALEAIAQKNNDLKEGIVAYKSGNYKEAILFFNKALEKEPAKSEAKFYRALSAYRQQNFPEAAAEFTQLAGENVNGEIASASFNNAGLAFANNDNLAQAVEMFKMALKASPGDAEIRRNLQKAILELKKQQPPPSDKKEQEPPMEKEDANQKLQDITDQEREAREKMKPRKSGALPRKNW